MVSTPQNKQQNRRLVSQLDYCDQTAIISGAVSSEQQNVVVNNAIADRESFVNNNDSSALANEKAVDVQTSETNLSDSFTKEMSNVVETVEDTIQNTVLTAVDNIITHPELN